MCIYIPITDVPITDAPLTAYKLRMPYKPARFRSASTTDYRRTAY
ncbi:MAG: hypothetical protein PHE56_12795 [Bacteroidales bacterium]|nr:hypothetical protein [Bacteroidales bacterium]